MVNTYDSGEDDRQLWNWLTSGGTANPQDTPPLVRTGSGTTGGATPFRILNVGTTGQVIKASAGQLYLLDLSNSDTAAVYVKLYDKATAPSSSDTPTFTTMIPAASGRVVPLSIGAAFTAGISVRASAAQADNDNTAPTASTVQISGTYK